MHPLEAASRTVAVLSLALWPWEISWTQVQVEISAMKDNTLYESSIGALSNGAGQYFFAGTNSIGAIRRGLIAFDIAGSVPTGSLVTSAVLTLHASTPQPDARAVELRRVLADWGEAGSIASGGGGGEGGGGPADTGDATWLHRFYDAVFWTTPGGDFSINASASLVVGTTGFYSWGSTPEMVGDVQSWLETPAANFGWLLAGVEGAPSTAKRFDTRENDTIAFRPVLTIVYTPMVGVTERSKTPSTFLLHQNHPNPFNPATTIRYDLPVGGHVSLTVYDMTGRKVRTLVDQTQAPGIMTAVWDGMGEGGTPAGSGMYFCKLEAGGFVQTRKMILLK